MDVIWKNEGGKGEEEQIDGCRRMHDIPDDPPVLFLSLKLFLFLFLKWNVRSKRQKLLVSSAGQPPLPPFQIENSFFFFF